MPQKIYIITGTTAVGKTQFALDFAEQADAEIVSCDASLFYRGMDIGTAKPNAVEQARVQKDWKIVQKCIFGRHTKLRG